MDAKEWYCIRIGVTEPYKTTQINTDFMCDLMQEYAEHYHASQTEIPSKNDINRHFRLIKSVDSIHDENMNLHNRSARMGAYWVIEECLKQSLTKD